MMGGYSNTIFVTKPSERFECPLCFEILRDPYQCSNGNLFCKTCIESALERKSCCPMCNVVLTPALLSRSIFVQQFIEEMDVVCISHGVDDKYNIDCSCCDWKGPLHARQRHYETECDCFLMKCENVGCEVQVFRKSFSDHSEVCPFTMVNCQLCNKSILRHATSAHKQFLLVCDSHLAEEFLDSKIEQYTGVATVSKSSKKNAKKAAKRNVGTAADALMRLRHPLENSELITLVSDFMLTMPKVMLVLQVIGTKENIASSEKRKAHQKFEQLTSRFFSYTATVLGNAPHNELINHLDNLFVLDANSVLNLLAKSDSQNTSDRMELGTIYFAKFFIKTYGIRFLAWCRNASNIKMLTCIISKLMEDTSETVVAFKHRHAYQCSVELTVSGAGVASVNGNYRYNSNGDSFGMIVPSKDENTAHDQQYSAVITLTKTPKAIIWYISYTPVGEVSGPLYCQVANSLDEPVPSETKEWLRSRRAIELEGCLESDGNSLIVTVKNIE